MSLPVVVFLRVLYVDFLPSSFKLSAFYLSLCLKKFSIEGVPSCFILFKTKKDNLLLSNSGYESLQS